ncbi:MFS transporter [Qipengyuania pelagi]|nr:MFS transporter [Qipengyuania pelagi]
MKMPGTPARAATNRPGWVILTMLTVTYTLNIIDRQVVGILSQQIQADLQLTDTQLGLMGGIAFAALYSVLAIPFAVIADQKGPAKVVAVSLAAWSIFTGLCGLAANFPQLLLARLGVGVGEAGGAAPSYALVAAHFPPERRARAIGVFTLAIPLGAAIGALFGGFIAHTFSWRVVFIALGIIGIALTPLFRLLVPEPPRGADTAAHRIEPKMLLTTWGILARMPSFWLIASGTAIASMANYGLAFWLPALMQRSFELDLLQTSWFFGGLVLIGGVAGTYGGGFLADRFGRRDRAAYARVPAAGFILATPLYAVGMLSDDWRVAFLAFLIPQAMTFSWFAPVMTATQQLVEPRMRATASASMLLIINMIGIGAGTSTLGWLSTRFAPDDPATGLQSALLTGLSFYAAGGVLLWIGGAWLRRAWREDE